MMENHDFEKMKRQAAKDDGKTRYPKKRIKNNRDRSKTTQDDATLRALLLAVEACLET